MRDGQYITNGNFADMTMDQIITNMVGREIKEKFPRVSCEKGKKVFEVKHLNAGKWCGTSTSPYTKARSLDLQD